MENVYIYIILAYMSSDKRNFFTSKIVFTSHHEVQTFLKETLETLQTIIHFVTNFTQISS